MRWFVRNFEFLISATAFSVMLGIICLNVFLRFTGITSLPYAEEIAYLGFDYAVFFGASMLYRMHGLIAVTVIVDRMPEALRRGALVMNFVVLSVANSYLFYLGWFLTEGSWDRKSAYLEYAYFWVNLAPTVAFGLMTAYSLYFLYRVSRGAPLEEFSDASISDPI